MVPVLDLENEADCGRVEAILGSLRLDAAGIALSRGDLAEAEAAVRGIMEDVARRGDQAVIDANRRFDDPDFPAEQLRVSGQEMHQAAERLPAEQLGALRRSIAQVRQYQSHIMPKNPPPLRRPGVELGLRFTPVESAGLYVPGGHAAYPSSLIMLAVPAQVAGVRRIVVVTPPSRYGRSDLFLAACHELGLKEVYRAGGAGIAAMAFGTQTIPRVDKIVGPGNRYIQLAKRLLAGVVGIDGFLGPSEVLVLADESGRPDFIAADMLAQAEHDPGSAYLLTTSRELARAVGEQIVAQLASRVRREPIERSLSRQCAIVVGGSMERLIGLANRFAAEHVSIHVRDEQSVLARLQHAGAVFVGRWSAVAAGDYLAGPSHCLPTNTTARFSSGVSVYEFLKRSSVVRYEREGLAADAGAIRVLAEAEHLDGHAASVAVRLNAS